MRQKLIKVNNKFYDWGTVSHAGAPVINISLLRLISPAELINFHFKKYTKDLDVSRVTATYITGCNLSCDTSAP